MTDHQRINQSSCDVEKFTPQVIIAAARRVMPIIHLDPASCDRANQIVGAVRFYTKLENGLEQPWIADNIWLNHPYGKFERACKANCTKKRCLNRGFCITEDI